MTMMKAVVFKEKHRLSVEEVPKPRPGALTVAMHPFAARPDRMPHLVGARALDDQC